MHKDKILVRFVIMDIDRKKVEASARPLAVGIFRYGLIAPAIHMSLKERREYFKCLEVKEFEVPYYGTKKYNAGTLKNWLLRYKNGGLDNLTPSTRIDAGISKKITEKVADIIKQIITDFPYISISGIYRMLIHEGHIRTGDLAETTLRHYISKNKLKEANQMKEPRKKFEKENINELWTADFMVGPYIQVGKKKMQTFLCAIIDDHSRMIVGAGWYIKQNCVALALTLKKAISIYGIPSIFYVDQGKVFHTNYLHLICARLGIALIHAKPYSAASKGKVERWFRTVREKFLNCIDISKIKDITELNKLFEKWVDEEYHNQCHSGIGEKPIDRYINSANKTKIRTITEHELDYYFLNTITRKVKNDATISIAGKLYEVPSEFIGKVVDLRFPIDNPDKITIYEDNKPVCLIREVNPALNATKPYTGIHFKDIEKKEEK